jgi:hypothetical protein
VGGEGDSACEKESDVRRLRGCGGGCVAAVSGARAGRQAWASLRREILGDEDDGGGDGDAEGGDEGEEEEEEEDAAEVERKQEIQVGEPGRAGPGRAGLL